MDFTKLREGTFYDEGRVAHVDMSYPYCPEIRSVLMRAGERVGQKIWGEAVLACTEGPRYETPAEVRMLQSLGCDIVGMTGVPEAALAREMQMCYASLCYVSNMAVGLQNRQITSELASIANRMKPTIREVLIGAIMSLPKTRNCVCAHALENARL
jgi:5'-methylthioadenosine phosphorylase